MSSYEHYRLAIQQMALYHQQMDEYLRVHTEVEELRQQVVSRQKKHRRCDKDIHKTYQVLKLLYSVGIVNELMPQISP